MQGRIYLAGAGVEALTDGSNTSYTVSSVAVENDASRAPAAVPRARRGEGVDDQATDAVLSNERSFIDVTQM